MLSWSFWSKIGSVAKTLLLSGFDLWETELPDDARILLPPFPLPALEPFKSAVAHALEDPAEGDPLANLVRPNSTVAVVVDDFSLPVPPVMRDCRGEMLEGVLHVLEAQGV